MDELIKGLEEANNKIREALALTQEIQRDLMKMSGQDELWDTRDNKNEDSNFEPEG